MLEIAKFLATLLSGGLAGAFINEWYRRKHGRLQPIPLIERVNRLVSPEVQGITLARVVGSSTSRQLEEVKNLREYQITMRNTSSIHLEDAEVQFEFPADDVQAWASRPTLSKTALVHVNATATEPWRKAFRWRIPHLPSGDSVEFTFQAVDPSSESYEAALYHSHGIVFERTVGEPPPKKGKLTFRDHVALALVAGFVGLILWALLTGRIHDTTGNKLTTIELAGCDLRVVSLFDLLDRQHYSSPWLIQQRIFNVGSQDCVIKSEKINVANLSTIKPGEVLEKERLAESAPTLLDVEISVGATSSSLSTTTVPLYVAR